MAITISGDSPNLTSPNITGAVLSAMASSVITSGTAVASTSGTSIDFTGIPSWVKRVTVMLNGVSTNGSSNYLIQIGAGSVTSSGYLGASSTVTTSVASTAFTAGFGIYNNSGAGNVFHGNVTITLQDSTNWTASGTVALSNVAGTQTTAGSLALGGTLDRVRITTVNGTDTFDAGSINILFE